MKGMLTIFSDTVEEKWVSVSSRYVNVGEIDKYSTDNFPIALPWAASL